MNVNSNAKANLSLARDFISHAVIFWVVLSFAGYFLITTKQGSAIPTYFLALTGLLGTIIYPLNHALSLRKSKTFLVLCCLLSYVVGRSFVQNSLDAGNQEFQSVLIDVMVLLFAAIAFSHVPKKIDLPLFAMMSILVGASVAGGSIILIEVFGVNIDYTGAWNVPQVAAIAFGFSVLPGICYVYMYRTKLLGLSCVLFLLVSLVAIAVVRTPLVFFSLLVALAALSFTVLWETKSKRSSGFWVLICVVFMVLLLQVFGILEEENRSDIWSSTLDQVFVDGLVFGSGYPTASTSVIECVSSNDGQVGHCSYDHPHNLYVATIYQLGLIGFLLVFALYLLALGVLFEQGSQDRRLLAGCLFYSAAVFIFDGQQLIGNMDFVWLILWLPIFLTIREEFNYDPY